MLSRFPLRLSALAGAALFAAACSEPHDPAKLWTGRMPAVQAGGTQPAQAEGARTPASFDSAASAPLVVGTYIAR